MFPTKPQSKPQYNQDNFDVEILTDFSGGLNVTDSEATQPKNQFGVMSNIYYDREGQVYTRPQFRPMTFSNSIQDKPIEVTISANTYVLTDIQGQRTFQEDVSDWSYDGELHVVWGAFTYSATIKVVVAAYCESLDKWEVLWSEDTSTTSTVTVEYYRINQAFDLLIFPDNSKPQRCVLDDSSPVTGSGGTLSDLGLTAPSATAFTPTGTEGTNGDGFSRVTAGTLYYKYAYFYDDKNVTTKYGESSATLVTPGNTDAMPITVDATNKGQVSIAFTGVTVPAGVSKVMVYRAPFNTIEGPYKFIGETEVTSVSAITTYIDSTPFGFEGVEDVPAGSDPSVSPTLAVLHVRNLSGYLVGFDASMPYKLIWCTAGQPDVWNPLNFDYLDSEGRVAIEFNRKFYAFTESSTYQKVTMEEPAFKISNIGTVDGNSVQDVGHGLMWMDYDTVYFADFVQQYGSKGDFPRDDGHRIAKTIKKYDDDAIIYSAFFERRYYLTFLDTTDFVRKTFVFDVDINAWTQHSMPHSTISPGRRTLYSVGNDNEVSYVYEHDYSDVVPASSSSTYDGKDYHDYNAVNGTTAFVGMQTITALIRKGNIHFGGEFRKCFISSVTLLVEGPYVDADVTVSGADNEFETTRSFEKQLGIDVPEEVQAVWAPDSEEYGAVWAAGSPPGDATLAEQGWAGTSEGYDNIHKKIRRVIKSNRVNILVSNTDSRDLKILGFAVYYKLLPLVA